MSNTMQSTLWQGLNANSYQMKHFSKNT